MTTPMGADEHPEITELSALTEGLLSPGRSARLRAHLADCSLCEEVRASLDEIRGTLGSLPGPARMPDDVIGRIDAALAAEALLDATADQVSRETRSRPHATPEKVAPAVSRETTTPPGATG